MAMARSCSWSGWERPIEASSSETSTRRFEPSPALIRLSPIEPRRDRARMGVEPFGLGERDGGGSKLGEATTRRVEKRGALHEVDHAEPGGETRRARRRQHMVRAAHIVAD